jgi:hypothetical protein
VEALSNHFQTCLFYERDSSPGRLNVEVHSHHQSE